jgi:hypothetical protein
MIDLSQLEDKLNKLPHQIRTQQDIVNEKMKLLEESKLEYDVCFGITLTGSKASSATDRKSMATIGSQKEAEKVIEAKYNLEKEKSALKYLENRFVALRKISSIENDLHRVNASGF